MKRFNVVLLLFVMAASLYAGDHLQAPQKRGRWSKPAPRGVFIRNVAFTPEACTVSPFSDVAIDSPYCRWIKQLYTDGISGGCGGGNYCPDSPVTRAQMAVFLETAMRGTPTWSTWQGLYRQTVLVSPTPGATPLENGGALREALSTIADASNEKRYLLKIEPGIYDLGDSALSMVSYVDIEGSGVLSTVLTRSTGATGTYDAIVEAASESELRSLGISSAGLPASCVFIAPGVNARLTDLRITVDGTGEVWGIVSESAGTSSAIIRNVEVDVISRDAGASAAGINIRGGSISNTTVRSAVFDGSAAYGLTMEGPGTAELTDVTANVVGNGYTAGLQSILSMATKVRDASITVTGGSSGRPVEVFSGGMLEMSDARLTTIGGTVAVGVLNAGIGTTILEDVSIETGGASTTNEGIRNSSADLALRNSYIRVTGTLATGINNTGSGGVLKIFGGSVSGTSALVNTAPYLVRVGAAQLEGTVSAPGGGLLVCVASFNGAFAELPPGCI